MTQRQILDLLDRKSLCSALNFNLFQDKFVSKTTLEENGKMKMSYFEGVNKAIVQSFVRTSLQENSQKFLLEIIGGKIFNHEMMKDL